MLRKVRKNRKLACDLLEVARLFATSNIHDATELETCGVIISQLREGNYHLAKKQLDSFARPEFGTPSTYYARKQFYALLAKVPFRGSTRTRKLKAIESFEKSEAQCRRTNKKLCWYSSHPNRMPETVRVVLSRARGIVRQVLGPFDESRLEQLIALSRPGSGVAIGTHNRHRVSLPYKLSDTSLSVTPDALPYARMLVETSSYWFRLHAEIDWKNCIVHVPYNAVHGNRFTFVPKDSRTLRTIAIEPSLNVCLQLGVHAYIARRLKDFGNDIEDQSRNQKMAAYGSTRLLGHSVSTLDLSSASDSVSTELVKMLLSPEWFGYLDDIRSKVGDFEGVTRAFEKFSSMGNGATFALETLLFLALARAVDSVSGSDFKSSCYGDDIIVGDRSSLLLTEVLKWCGFSINHEKSFYLGPFRESCGADWHTGLRVTPQYIKKALLRPTDVYLLLNRADPFFNWGSVRNYLLCEHRKVEPILFGLENQDSSNCLFTTFDYLKGIGGLKWNYDEQTYYFKVWVFRPEQEKVSSLVGLSSALFGARSREARYQLRGRGTFRLKSITPGVNPELPRLLLS